MAKKKRAPYALLGMLRYGALTGYELRSAIQSGLAMFWQEGAASIYPALRELEALGYVESAEESGRPVKIRYRITAAGRSAFAAWMREEPEPPSMRDEFALKLFFGDELGPEGVAVLLRREASRLEALAKGIEAAKARLPVSVGEASRYWLLTAAYGRALADAARLWCSSSLETLAGEKHES